jgi:hypothetical protein
MCCAGLGCMIGEGRGGSFPLGGRSSGRRRVRGAGLRICADGDGLGACMKASLKKPLAVVSRMLADRTAPELSHGSRLRVSVLEFAASYRHHERPGSTTSWQERREICVLTTAPHPRFPAARPLRAPIQAESVVRSAGGRQSDRNRPALARKGVPYGESRLNLIERILGDLLWTRIGSTSLLKMLREMLSIFRLGF